MNPVIEVKKTNTKHKCVKCFKQIYKGEKYYKYNIQYYFCKFCARKRFEELIEKYRNMLSELQCGAEYCDTCERKIQCIT